MKKILIIQLDAPYFLLETIQLIENNKQALNQWEIILVAERASIDSISSLSFPLIKGITDDKIGILDKEFDTCVNLSLSEEGRILSEKIKSTHKKGILKRNGELVVSDLWSTYLLTIQNGTPFLTFHLQDIYLNIIGLKKNKTKVTPSRKSPNQIAYVPIASHLFKPEDQEKLIIQLANQFLSPVKDLSEIDLMEDVSRTIYIGPASLESLQFCEAGGRAIFLTSFFQGFNLIPSTGDHIVISSSGEVFESRPLSLIIENKIYGKVNHNSPYSIYEIEDTNGELSRLKTLRSYDGNYPFYQAYVILWSFIINLTELKTTIPICNLQQLNLIKQHTIILEKLIKIYDHALDAIDKVQHESRSINPIVEVLSEKINIILEIESIVLDLSKSHSLLRPILDFYRIKKTQNEGVNLQDHSFNSFLSYTEEQQALKALLELLQEIVHFNELAPN